jgi:acyl carrier protein
MTMEGCLERLLRVARATGRALLAAAEAAVAYSSAEYAFRVAVRSRAPMDDETFWATSYKKSGIPYEIATTVRRVYGERLGHDPLKLRAADFDPAMWDIDTVELVLEVEDAFGISICDSEAETTSGSIDSLVQLVARKPVDAPLTKLPIEVTPTGLAPARRTASSA